MQTLTSTVQLRLTPEDRVQLGAEARASERTVSQLIRLAIRQYLEQSRESTRAYN